MKKNVFTLSEACQGKHMCLIYIVGFQLIMLELGAYPASQTSG